ncbi:MAG: hypothetical protein JW715_09370 [Sedimentisphaerales bacterium]|nr:hypothetical protein [Sedimentisphaerales bacterium]
MMKKQIFLLFLCSAISFIIGFALCFIAEETARIRRANENRRIEKLKTEASSFFYKTMRELYEGTYNPENVCLPSDELERFKEYRPKLEPKCYLSKLDFAYDTYSGFAFFPSGEAYEVNMKKIDNDWKLTHFFLKKGYLFWHNLQLNKEPELNRE